MSTSKFLKEITESVSRALSVSRKLCFLESVHRGVTADNAGDHVISGPANVGALCPG